MEFSSCLKFPFLSVFLIIFKSYLGGIESKFSKFHKVKTQEPLTVLHLIIKKKKIPLSLTFPFLSVIMVCRNVCCSKMKYDGDFNLYSPGYFTSPIFRNTS